MARYHETAAKANEVAKELMALLPEDAKVTGTILMAKLVNLGFRCNPRAAHSTIRENTVRGAMRGLPVTVRIEKLPCQDRFGRPTTGNFLTLNGVVENETEEEGANEAA
jgi:hypothetical protein